MAHAPRRHERFDIVLPSPADETWSPVAIDDGDEAAPIETSVEDQVIDLRIEPAAPVSSP